MKTLLTAIVALVAISCSNQPTNPMDSDNLAGAYQYQVITNDNTGTLITYHDNMGTQQIMTMQKWTSTYFELPADDPFISAKRRSLEPGSIMVIIFHNGSIWRVAQATGNGVTATAN